MATSTFLVREARTRRLIGMFCARRSNDLFVLLDEQTDPFECEYLELRAGEGLFIERLLHAADTPYGHPDGVSDAGTSALHERADACVLSQEDPCWHSLALDGLQPVERGGDFATSGHPRKTARSSPRYARAAAN